MVQLPENRRITRAQILEIFEITKSTLSGWMYNGRVRLQKPDPKDDKFDIEDVANYLLARSSKGRGQVHLSKIAMNVKNKFTTSPKKAAPKKKVTRKKASPRKPKSLEEGIEFAVKRAQRFEKQLAEKVEEAHENEDISLIANSLQNWSKTLEILRKVEVDCLKVLEEKGQLMRVDEVREIYAKGIIPVKTRMTALPVQLANQLADQDEKTIIQILSEAIEKTLTDISRVWDGEEDE